MNSSTTPYFILAVDEFNPINKIPSFLSDAFSFLPLKEVNIVTKVLDTLQLVVTGSLPLIHAKDFKLCTKQCPNEKAILSKNIYGLGTLNFNFKAPLVNKQIDVTPKVMFDPFYICLPIPLLTWYRKLIIYSINHSGQLGLKFSVVSS